jgi:ubiquitin-like domain-containing CTD phosphatase 1
MEAVYQYYDLVIWSQTHWKWLEIKLTELGMLFNPKYNLCCVLDKTSMFRMKTGHVKPLAILWSKFPQQWNSTNTIHVDDLARNFELNKANGITISPYNRNTAPVFEQRSSRKSSAEDEELFFLSQYLCELAQCGVPLDSVDHRAWRKKFDG